MKSKEEQLKEIFKSTYNAGNRNAITPEDCQGELQDNFNKWFVKNKDIIQLLFQSKELIANYYSEQEIKDSIDKINISNIVYYHQVDDYVYNGIEEQRVITDLDVEGVIKSIKTKLLRTLNKRFK